MSLYHDSLQNDPIGQAVATLIANFSMRRMPISTATLAIALNQPSVNISNALEALVRLGFVDTLPHSPGHGWCATAALMAAWDSQLRPTIPPQTPKTAIGFERCKVCASPNRTVVRHCTYCGVQMKGNRESAQAASEMRASERATCKADESVVASDHQGEGRSDAAAHSHGPSMKSWMEECKPVPLITRERVRE